MPTRFKYTPVQPQSFALTPAEILMATDTELNQYLSVKKYAPYRKENNWDRGRVDRLKDLKQTVTERSHRMGMSGGGSYQDVDGERKKRKGKKERLKMKAVADGAVEEGSNVHVEVDNGDELNGKRKRKHEKVEETETVQEGTVSGGKKRRRHKKTEQM
jgi:protein KRI1